MLKPLDPWIVNMILCIIVAAATEVTSNVAMCTLLMPILAELVSIFVYVILEARLDMFLEVDASR